MVEVLPAPDSGMTSSMALALANRIPVPVLCGMAQSAAKACVLAWTAPEL